MAKNSFGWDNWTGTGVNDADSLAAEIDRIKKWQRTHSGIDFASAGLDYPHPSQKVRSLYFFEGRGRLNEDGIEIIAPPENVEVIGISWQPQFTGDTSTPVFPRAQILGVTNEDPDGEYASSLYLRAQSEQFINHTTIRLTSQTDGTAGGPLNTIELGVNATPITRVLATLTGDPSNGLGKFTIANGPLQLTGFASDFTGLTLVNGMIWYRSDLDEFRVRIGGVTYNLATTADIPTTMNKQPFAAKTTTYVTTANDGVVSVDATTASFTVTLVTAVGNAGLTQTFKKINAANVVTIDGNSSETIDGLTTYALSAQWSWVTLVCTGSGWIVTGAG